MIAVGVVERARDLVVRVAAVRYGEVTARFAVPVAAFHRSAGAGPAAVHVELVLVRVVFVRCVEVAVVEVVHVPTVRHRPVAAVGSVLVAVAIVLPAGHGRAVILACRASRRQVVTMET